MALTAERETHFVGELRGIMNAAAAGLDGRLVDPATLPKDKLDKDPAVLEVMLAAGDMSLFSVKDAYLDGIEALQAQVLAEGGTDEDYERIALIAFGKLEATP